MTVDEVYLEIGQNIYNIIEDDEFLNATLKKKDCINTWVIMDFISMVKMKESI